MLSLTQIWEQNKTGISVFSTNRAKTQLHLEGHFKQRITRLQNTIATIITAIKNIKNQDIFKN